VSQCACYPKRKNAATAAALFTTKLFGYANTTTFPPHAPFVGNPKTKETQSLQSLTGGMGYFLE
jgi:hypothetical protein